jgi:hypothetical protein
MEIKIESHLLDLIASTKVEISKVIPEALNLWLKDKLIICPITRSFCISNKPCNECKKIQK